MNKISIYALTFFLSLSSVTVYSQKNNKQVIFTNEQGSDIFYHTIERGQNRIRHSDHVWRKRRGYLSVESGK